MKTVPKQNAIYSFYSGHPPIEHVELGESILLETEDALGGQIKDESVFQKLDWSRVNGATGPIFVNGVQPGDTLIVNIQSIEVANKGVIVVVPRQGALGGKRRFKAATKVVHIERELVIFDDEVEVKVRPMIGTIGVAPEKGQVSTGTPGKHGGNMDVKELVAGTRLFLPVFAEGGLFAAGDLHAAQADGEICVSAVEVPGKILVSFDVAKGKTVSWPILETSDNYHFITSGKSLDDACVIAVETAVEAIMREYSWPFEKAYMSASLMVDLEINQVVDPKKGVRAVLSKKLITPQSFYATPSNAHTKSAPFSRQR